jgi:hypothetical protein
MGCQEPDQLVQASAKCRAVHEAATTILDLTVEDFTQENEEDNDESTVPTNSIADTD